MALGELDLPRARAPAAPPSIQRRLGGDAVQERRKARLAPEAVAVPVEAQEGFLCRVLGLLPAAEHPVEQAKHVALVVADEPFEGTRVAANAALNRRRSRGRARAREIELAQRHASGSQIHVAPRDPEDATHGAEIQNRVQEALQQLPEELRMAVVLYDIEGQSYKDIAEILGIPEGTVKSRIHRARLGLRERLKELVQSSSTGEKP